MGTPKAEWKKRIEQWKESGLSAKEYAAKIGVNSHTLRCWRGIFEKEARKARPGVTKATKRAPNSGEIFPFVEFHAPRKDADSRFELELKPGWCLRVPAEFESKSLVQLLRALQEVA